MTAEAIQDVSMVFKKALIERALGDELTHHLGYPPVGDKPAEADAIASTGHRQRARWDGQTLTKWAHRHDAIGRAIHGADIGVTALLVRASSRPARRCHFSRSFFGLTDQRHAGVGWAIAAATG